MFNSQSRIQIGGKWSELLGRVGKPFLGVMAGLVYNKMRPLELARQRRPRTDIMGHIKVLDTIPFNYRQTHLDKFERMQMTQTSDSPGIQDDIIVRSVK